MTLDHLSRPVNQVLKKAPKAQTHDLSSIFLRPVKRPNISPWTALEVLAGKIPILDRSYDGMKVLSMAKPPNIYLAWSLFLRVWKSTSWPILLSLWSPQIYGDKSIFMVCIFISTEAPIMAINSFPWSILIYQSPIFDKKSISMVCILYPPRSSFWQQSPFAWSVILYTEVPFVATNPFEWSIILYTEVPFVATNPFAWSVFYLRKSYFWHLNPFAWFIFVIDLKVTNPIRPNSLAFILALPICHWFLI